MTRQRWLLLGAALIAIALVITGTFALRPLLTGPDPAFGPDATASPTTSPPPPPWESTSLPGYDPDPGELELTPLDQAQGEAITVSLALEPDAVTTGGEVGLSFDATELANPMWDSDRSNLTLTLQELDRPVLRFGGNGVDRRMWWTSSGEPAPEWAEATVTPKDLERVAAVADEVDAEVTIALDLGHDDPARAADMAAHAHQAFGDRLLAVAIGNEPNGYFHPNQPQLAVRGEAWGPYAYQASLREYSQALQKTVPGLPIAGPGAYDATWWRAFADSGIPDQRALSMHWYPLWDCGGPASSIANPTVDDLTSPELREQARHIIGMGADVASENDLPLWIEETGPTSCPGTNDTSRTHAQALWTVDFVMTAAELGVERMAFHSTLQACQGGAPMSPLCATGDLADPGLIVEGRTSYLALMLLGQLPDGRVLSPAVSGDGMVMVHGVLAEDGSLALMVVDLRDPTTAEAAPVQISAPSGLPAGAAASWELTEGSRLSGEALISQESTLTAPAPITGEFAGATLGRAAPMTVTSDPGAVALLRFEPVREPDPSDGGGESTAPRA
ncbi:hypothetical protein CFK38_04675 [Brachybacterium vulturis]|uniref:Uncharacterized protein n=1 Tax=Brachybacterium vulturis TaxID=2017484 RepID=A0A291GLF1_9MICO|nr:hypothetical protein [Brachybacterium vulturis]ATG50900.1 hypothetical protein CFK38_04675 [Brachybacterium vulturis]